MKKYAGLLAMIFAVNMQAQVNWSKMNTADGLIKSSAVIAGLAEVNGCANIKATAIKSGAYAYYCLNSSNSNPYMQVGAFAATDFALTAALQTPYAKSMTANLPNVDAWISPQLQSLAKQLGIGALAAFLAGYAPEGK
jgi:hypothetical protein